MSPWFLTGFVDAEGCFNLSIYRDTNYNLGWRVKLSFQIHLHKKDSLLLEQIQKFLDAGKIFKKTESTQYYITSVRDLELIIKHLDNYRLHTKKWSDYELFKKSFIIIKNKEHLTLQGLNKIVSIKASLNLGLSEQLKTAFANISPADKPILDNIIRPDPLWLAGFTSGEGCFLINVYKAKTKVGVSVRLVFQLTQHLRDELLMRSLIEYFECGNLYKDRNAWEYRVEKFSDIETKIIPFFSKYKIQGVKLLDYLDWCKAGELIKTKTHLTEEGLDLIRKIKAGLNKERLL